MSMSGNPRASRMSGVAPKRVNYKSMPAATNGMGKRFKRVRKVAKKKVATKKRKSFVTKKTGTYKGKSNKLGHGGRAAQLTTSLRSKGYSKAYAGAIVGKIAREKGAAPGQKHYHGHR